MKVHLTDWNNMLQGVEAVTGNCDPLDADTLVLFNDVRGSCRDITETAKKLGKKVYVMQHGRAATRDYDKPNSFPLIADKFLAWGKADYDRMAKLGYADKVEIVGCPVVSKIQARKPHDGKYVVFIPVNTGKEEPMNLKVYYELLKMQYDRAIEKIDGNKELVEKWPHGTAFHQLTDINVVAKLLPRHEKQLYHGSTFISNPDDPNHTTNLFEILSMADCIVTLDESTTEIMAMAAGVPVVCCSGFQYKMFGGKDMTGVEYIRTTGAYHTNLAGLKEAVYKALFDDTLADTRKSVVEHEIEPGDAIARILKAIDWK